MHPMNNICEIEVQNHFSLKEKELQTTYFVAESKQKEYAVCEKNKY